MPVAAQFDARKVAAGTAPIDFQWESFDDPILTRCVEQARGVLLRSSAPH